MCYSQKVLKRGLTFEMFQSGRKFQANGREYSQNEKSISRNGRQLAVSGEECTRMSGVTGACVYVCTWCAHECLDTYSVHM